MKFFLLAIFFSSSCILASKEGKIKYSYTLWIGDDVHRKLSIKMKSKDGIFFIDAMNEAADKNPLLTFEATDSREYGKFITKINGYANDPDRNTFWMLYNMTCNPDIHHKPGKELLSPLGVSSLRVEDQHHYLFWLKTVIW